MTFRSKLVRAQELASSLVCVGLDPDLDRLPEPLVGLPGGEAVRHFCSSIIQATAEFACAFKPNLAFFEALGRDGLAILADVVAVIPHDRIIIADGKRGDIGNSAERYAQSVFDQLGCDACTVSPYMGRDAVEPFLTRPGKAAIALVRTSNAGADEVQTLDVGGLPLFLKVADLVESWGSDQPGEVGFVVGATDSQSLLHVRRRHPETPLLIPGIGAQGGDTEMVMKAAQAGDGPVIVNSSRSILFAGSGADFAHRAAEATLKLRDELNQTSAAAPGISGPAS